jgi:hypothetical protein
MWDLRTLSIFWRAWILRRKAFGYGIIRFLAASALRVLGRAAGFLISCRYTFSL